LLAIIFIFFAKEFESPISTGVHASENHIDFVSHPTGIATERIYKFDNWRFSLSFDRNIKLIVFGHNRDSVLKICKARSMEYDINYHRHAWSNVRNFFRRLFDFSNREMI